VDQPADVREVLRDLIEQWYADRRPPERVQLENVRGRWTASTWEFLDAMVREGWYGGDILPGSHRESVEEITGHQVGTYGAAAGALLSSRPRRNEPGDAV
jgi:hypothetical protein